MVKILRTVDQLIEAFGGPAGMAEWAGVGPTAIANWSARNFIPPGWHLRIFAEACKRGLLLDLERLFDLPPEYVDVLRLPVGFAEQRRSERPRQII